MNDSESELNDKLPGIFPGRAAALAEKLRGALSHPASIFALFFVLMLGLFSLVRVQIGDDQGSGAVHLHYSLPAFMLEEYQSWSGRVLCDFLFYYFTGQALFLWKWLCALCITLCAAVYYRFATYNQDLTGQEKTLFACLSAGGVGLISSLVLFPSVFWVTGALVYLVPFSLAVTAFVPFFQALQNEDYQPSRAAFLYLVPAALTVLGAEQTALCFTAFCLLVLISLFIKKRRVPSLLWTMFAASMVLQIISLTAPGNAVRQAEEVGKWFPTFHQVGLFDRSSLSMHFLFNTVIDQWFLPLFFIWLITAILLVRSRPSRLSKIVALVSFGMAFLIGFRLVFPLDQVVSNDLGDFYSSLLTFHYMTKATIFQPAVVLPYILWGPGICIVPVSIFLIFKKSGLGFFYTTLYLAALASLMLMFFSPTMYASGARTSFTSNMLLVLLILLLLRHGGLLKYFAAAILFIALVKILMLYAYLGRDGYQFIDGTLNTKGIPFKVLR